MTSCCLSTSKTKKCVRESDQKTFTFPRKFSKEECIRGPIKGFTMRASCAPYLDCKQTKKTHKKKITNQKKKKNHKKKRNLKNKI